MSGTNRKLTTALAGLALASLPLLVDAQSTSTQSTQPSTPRQTTGSASQQTRGSRSTNPNSPQHHLDEAKRILSGINQRTMKGETATQIAQLKRHFNQLESSWRKSSASSARSGAARTTEPRTGTAGTTGSTPTEQTGTRQKPTGGTESTMAGGDWMTHYTAITTLLDQLGATSTSASGQRDTTGTATGTSGSAIASGSATLDPSVRTKLVEFRRHLDLFHETAMAQSGAGEEDVASASPESGITGSRTGTTASGTSASQPYPPTGAPESTASATGTTPQPPTSSPAAQQPPAATTSQQTPTASTTQTPTTGQVSASANVDAATIARLTASIDELLQGGAATSTAAGTTTGTTTGTTGAVGTSGTTSATGTVCVDRAKLEQLKRDIQALQSPPR